MTRKPRFRSYQQFLWGLCEIGLSHHLQPLASFHQQVVIWEHLLYAGGLCLSFQLVCRSLLYQIWSYSGITTKTVQNLLLWLWLHERKKKKKIYCTSVSWQLSTIIEASSRCCAVVYPQRLLNSGTASSSKGEIQWLSSNVVSPCGHRNHMYDSSCWFSDCTCLRVRVHICALARESERERDDGRCISSIGCCQHEIITIHAYSIGGGWRLQQFDAQVDQKRMCMSEWVLPLLGIGYFSSLSAWSLVAHGHLCTPLPCLCLLVLLCSFVFSSLIILNLNCGTL